MLSWFLLTGFLYCSVPVLVVLVLMALGPVLNVFVQDREHSPTSTPQVKGINSLSTLHKSKLLHPINLIMFGPNITCTLTFLISPYRLMSSKHLILIKKRTDQIVAFILTEQSSYSSVHFCRQKVASHHACFHVFPWKFSSAVFSCSCMKVPLLTFADGEHGLYF